MVDYEKVRRVTVFCHFAGAALLFLASLLRFVQLNFTSIDFILSLYYVLFGIIIILSELRMPKALEQFYFMNYSFGKAIFAGFIATITFSFYWIQFIVSMFFLAACGGFILLGFFFTSKEAENAIPKSSSQPSTQAARPAGEQKKEEKKEIELQNKLPAQQV